VLRTSRQSANYTPVWRQNEAVSDACLYRRDVFQHPLAVDAKWLSGVFDRYWRDLCCDSLALMER